MNFRSLFLATLAAGTFFQATAITPPQEIIKAAQEAVLAVVEQHPTATAATGAALATGIATTYLYQKGAFSAAGKSIKDAANWLAQNPTVNACVAGGLVGLGSGYLSSLISRYVHWFAAFVVMTPLHSAAVSELSRTMVTLGIPHNGTLMGNMAGAIELVSQFVMSRYVLPKGVVATSPSAEVKQAVEQVQACTA